MARRICGCIVMPHIPSAAIAMNQTTITGPKNRPTVSVPLRCMANSAAMTAAVMGRTRSANSGPSTFMPSTAESTEMAGVIMLSPKNSATPRMPTPVSTATVRGLPSP